MKYRLLFIGLLFGVSGCASLQEAYHTDREFGEATRISWQQQVAYPETMAQQTPEGVSGIAAEGIMDVYNGTFGEKPQQVNILSLGATGN